MPVRAIDEFSVVTSRSVAGERAGENVLLARRGIPMDRPLSGRNLLGQFAVDTRYLVLLDADCPFEESLHLHLLDSRLRLLESVVIGAPYHTGSLERVVTDGESLEFSFFSDERWRVMVHARPRWVMGPLPAGACYEGRWALRRWLEIRQRASRR